MSEHRNEGSRIDAASELWALEKQWAIALQNKDENTLSELLADSFISTAVRKQSEPASKSEYIREASLTSISKCEVNDFCVRQCGNLAIVKGELRFESPVVENRIHKHLLIIDVWFREGSQWKAMTRLAGDVTIH